MTKIEIELTDFREINDKIGGIKSAALLAKTATERERISCINHIIRWAQEITFRLNNGTVIPPRNTGDELLNESAAIIVVLQNEIKRLEEEGQNDPIRT